MKKCFVSIKNIRLIQRNNLIFLIALLSYILSNIQIVHTYDAFNGLTDTIFNKFDYYFGPSKTGQSKIHQKHHNHAYKTSKSSVSGSLSKFRFKSYFFASSSSYQTYFLINFRLKYFSCGELLKDESKIFNLSQLCDGEVNCNDSEGEFNDENYPFCNKKYQKFCNFNGVFIVDPENIKDSFCICDNGWKGNYCEIRDEKKCGEDKIICHKNAECRSGNTDGNKDEVCVCKNGFFGDGIDNCQDINECEENICDINSEYCKNLNGGFLCCGNTINNKRCRFIHGQINYKNKIYKEITNNGEIKGNFEINKERNSSIHILDRSEVGKEYNPVIGSSNNVRSGGEVIVGSGKLDHDIFTIETKAGKSNKLKGEPPCNCSKATEGENPKIILKSKFFDVIHDKMKSANDLKNLENSENNLKNPEN
uniref:Matrilin-2 (inferred by orthology to a human protein) n=1 Tax=Strongyloides venezuelensis TaxID=75913 RepID=A0A0K0FWZ7_STRVS